MASSDNRLTARRRLIVSCCVMALLLISRTVATATGGVLTGNGTAASPYIVMDYADLKAVGTTYGLNMVYRLGADIDASASATENAGAGFAPISNSSTQFTGEFHGAGHVIRNLTINRRGNSFIGLIGRNWGVIDSLGLINADVKADNDVGALVGENRGTVSRCYATGSVYGWGGIIGGLVGTTDGYSTPGLVSNCYAKVTVTGGGGMGGLVGSTYYGTVTGSYATGSVTATSTGAGGLVGWNTVGTITGCYATVPVSGTNSVGGLIGYNYFYYARTVSNSYSTGTVAGTGTKIGGFVGHNFGWSVGTVNGCYSTGKVTGTGGTVGGFIGLQENASTSGCYWNATTSGVVTGIGSNAGTGTVTALTDGQMKNSANFSGWNFPTTWTIRIDSTYPALAGVDDAPFAFTDTIAVARTFPLATLLANDCDPEVGRSNLLMSVLSVSQGTISNGVLNLPPPIARGSATTLSYRVGEIRATDTLWGNVATAVLNLTLMSGSGTDLDPYLVENYGDLKSVGVTYGLDKVYRLVADIDATPSATEHGDSGFVPIGRYVGAFSTNYPFTGVFHGGGHVIRNLVVNRPGTDGAALFGMTAGSMIDSVGLVGGSVTGGVGTGALVGRHTSGSQIAGCYATLAVSGSGYSGGLIGLNSGSGASITGSFATGAVTSVGAYAGGLIGHTTNSSTISRCYATGAVTAGSNAGGFIGYNSTGAVSDCYATGPVTAIGSAGGFEGNNASLNATISNCYATGRVTGSPSGGLVGSASNGTITSSYWNPQTTEAIRGVGSGIDFAESLSTAQMKQVSSFVGWSFDTTWTIRSDSTYPGLRGMDNAPFAFDETFGTGATVPLARLLSNDCDIESAKQKLLLQIDTVDFGAVNMEGAFAFPDTAALGSIANIEYRVGEVRLPDTLWGNHATATITRTLPGSGTPEDPYLVSNYTELKTVGWTYGFEKNYRLIADIDASASASEHGDSGFVPIGSPATPFRGIFSGGGHVVRNVTINRPTSDYVGFFGWVTNGVIDSLGVVSVSIRGRNVVGGVVGNDSGTVRNCYSTGTIRGNSYVGGVVGLNFPGTTLTDSYSTCTVTAVANLAGGVIGGNNGGTIERCYATGPVTGSAIVGGFAGNNIGTIRNSYATGSAKSSTGPLGGFAGSSGNGGNAIISHCYSAGAVTGGTVTGGFVGYNGNGSWIGYSYWDSLSSGVGNGFGSNLGGAYFSGLPTAGMQSPGSFPGWAFDTTWVIRPDSTYPGLASLRNAPFAFADTFTTVARTVYLSRLLRNDCDLESGQSGLFLRVHSLTAGTTDSTSQLTFPDTIANLTISVLTYRIGTLHGPDTLWGNSASAVITLDTVVVGVENEQTAPRSFALNQNYPNPFNPSTTIGYALPHASEVSLKVYNTLGEQVAVLVQEAQEAGEYQLRFDGRGLASGVYFYTLRAGDLVQTRRLILLK